MKLKENKEISYYGKLHLIFFLCCAVTVIIRTVQVVSFIDRETGFYIGGDLLKVVLYLVIAAASVFFALTSFLSKETAQITLKFEKDKLLYVFSCIISLCFLYDSFSAFSDSVFSMDNVSHSVSAFQSMMLSGTIPLFLQSIFALLSAVYFMFFAKGIIKGTDVAGNHKIIAVAPVCWAGFRLVHRFVEQISYIRISELLLELVLLSLFVLFFMAFAQVSSNVYVKNARWRIIGIGLPTALVALTLNVPRLVAVFTGENGLFYSKYPFNLCDFVLAIFIIALSVKLIKKENKPTEV